MGGLGHAGEDMTALIAQLVELRRRFPQLRPADWLAGRHPDGTRDVRWLTPQAAEMTDTDWDFPNGRFLAYVLGPTDRGRPALYIALNAAPEAIAITLPQTPAGRGWAVLINTATMATGDTFAPTRA